MKVAHVILRYSQTHGGVERYVWNLSHELVRRGHEVHIYSARHDGDGADRNIVFHTVPSGGLLSQWRMQAFADNSAGMLKNEKFDVIHGFGRTYFQDLYRVGGGCYTEYLKTMSRGLGFIGRFLIRANPKHRAILALEKRTFAPGSCKLVSCISRKCKEEIQRYYGVPDDVVEVVYNGVDLQRFSPEKRPAGLRMREKFGARSDETVLLFAGSGFERKGLRFALEAAALCAPNMPLKVFVVGHGDWAKYRRLVHRLHLEGRVMFLGRRENIEEFYAAADVFILPTLYEPFGSVVLEAMAAGLPCIVSSTSGASEILAHGVDSFVAQDPTSSPELAHLIDLLRDAETRRRIGTAARQTAMNYSLDANVSRTLHLYRRICEIKSRS